jgi:tellurite resistance protein TehA-like permease
MGTGAVYVTLAGLKNHSPALTSVETFFFFLNMALFLLNTSTLGLQAIRKYFRAPFVWMMPSDGITVYPRQSLRLIKDPVKGVFVPLVVLSFATIIIGTINYAVPSGHVHPGFIYELFWYVVFLHGTLCVRVQYPERQGLRGVCDHRLLPHAHDMVLMTLLVQSCLSLIALI